MTSVLSDADLVSIAEMDFSGKTEEEILTILEKYLSFLSEEKRREVAKKILADRAKK